ncbi:signal peptidase I [Gordonia sp. 'Campus']|uniref:signal peptidase I n=1 Tax=Gordonia sp. 'Campus' TaxID=2915824 RepID=UPI001EE420F5|nr:signal peptidase I [Gordonia sp. 'Campus']
MSDHETPRSRSRLVEFALTVGAVSGVVCVLMAACAFLFGVTPLMFRSGSMAPAIPTGSLALAREVPATAVVHGDVVSVVADNGNRITHRVVAVGERTGNSVPLTLKGDANSDPDDTPYVVTDVQRVLFSAPLLGYLVAWLSTPTALAAGIVLTVWLLVIVFRRDPRERRPIENDDTPRWFPSGPQVGPPRHAAGEWRMGISATVVLLIAALVVAEPAPARAAFTDTTVGQVTMTLGTVPRPASFTCTTQPGALGLTTAVLSWPVVGAAYRYRLEFRQTNGTLSETREVAAQASGTVTYQVTGGLLDLLGNNTNVSLFTLVGVNWVSASPTLVQRVSKNLLSTTCLAPGTVTSTAGAVAARQAPSTTSSTTSSTTVSSSSSSDSETTSETTSSSSSPTVPKVPGSQSTDGYDPTTTTTSPPAEGQSADGRSVPEASSSSSTSREAYR